MRTEVRRLDAKRTAFFAALGLAVAAFIAVDQLSGESGASGGIPAGGGPAESVVSYTFISDRAEHAPGHRIRH